MHLKCPNPNVIVSSITPNCLSFYFHIHSTHLHSILGTLQPIRWIMHTKNQPIITQKSNVNYKIKGKTDTYIPRVSNREAKGNLKTGPLCALPSVSTRSTASQENIY